MPALSAVNKISMSLGLATVCLLGSAQAMVADSCSNPQT